MNKPSFVESLESRLFLTAAPADPAAVHPPRLPDAHLSAADPTAPVAIRSVAPDGSDAPSPAVAFFPIRRAWFILPPPAPATAPASASTDTAAAAPAAATPATAPMPPVAIPAAQQSVATAREIADEEAPAASPGANSRANGAPASAADPTTSAAWVFSRRRIVLVSAPYEGPATSAERLSLDLIRSAESKMTTTTRGGITHTGTAAAPPQFALAIAPPTGDVAAPNDGAQGARSDDDIPTPALASIDPATTLLSLRSLRSQAAALAATLTVAAASLYAHLRNRRQALESQALEEATRPVELPYRPRPAQQKTSVTNTIA